MPAQKTIMLDGYNLGLEQGTGVATYARNLSYETNRLGYRTEILYGARASPSANRLLREIAFFDPAVGTPSRLLVASRVVKQFLLSPLGVQAVDVPITGNIVTRTFQSRLPYFDKIWNSPDLFGRSYRHHSFFRRMLTVGGLDVPDIMHWTYPLPIRVAGAKNIYTLHDLVPLRLPYTTLDNKKTYLRRLQSVLAQADHIVTVSETSRNDIINLFNYPEDKITNTYQSVEIPQKLLDKSDEVVRREVEGAFGLSYKGYFLFFGAIEPKKNIGRMIEGYLASGVPEPLVVVGKAAWKSEEELRFVNDTSNRYLEQIENYTFVRDRVRRFDYSPFPLLVSLIRGAKGLVFPSLYEGFGLPVLESMLLGTPVISSTEASIPEITGDTALLVDPYDTRAIAEAIREFSTNDALRADLAYRAKIRSELFSPARYRERLGALYGKLLDQ